MRLKKKTISNSTIAIITVILVLISLIAANELGIFKISIEKEIYETVGIVLGIVIVKFVSDRVKKTLARWDLNAAASISFIIQIFGYTLLFLVFISYNGGLSIALTTGGFAGIVLGLAAQASLSNVFAGLMIIFSRPFKPGDKITFATWQFGKIMPIYSPKFYSVDELVNGFSGVVKDISLMYTVIVTEDNLELKVPNSAMIQSAIIMERESTDLVRYRMNKIRLEFPNKKDPEKIKQKLAEIVKQVEEIKSFRIYVDERTPNTYVIIIEYTSSYPAKIVKDKVLTKMKNLRV
jgi:small-conductance mechanosensitive channel